MRKVTVSRMRERYAQTVLTFRITYVKDKTIIDLRDIQNYISMQGEENSVFCLRTLVK